MLHADLQPYHGSGNDDTPHCPTFTGVQLVRVQLDINSPSIIVV